MASSERVVAIGILTDRDIERLGPAFGRLFPIDETPCFYDLLSAIDQAERQLRPCRDAEA